MWLKYRDDRETYACAYVCQYIGIILLAISVGSITALKADDAASSILQRRRQQCYASMQEYMACQDEIDQIRAQYNASMPDDGQADSWWYPYLHVIPWIVWQLCAIAAALCIAYMLLVASGRPIRAMLVCIAVLCVSLYASWYGYQEYNQQYGVVCVPYTYARLGPDEHYPCQEKLSYLTEVCVVQRYHDWIKARYARRCGWLPRQHMLLSTDISSPAYYDGDAQT